ncbi:hypothetical protein VIBNISO65_380001 [Vibrio nigripulchritudo SO65]|nr:hypothetical protein VIBNIAM115_1340028 [Vibrio nigripulchritudo AM115]CCN41113.1 hypothetical protein VIBNIFTn2_1470054 [Vibrio nigripulchritudo FTn2]CCN77751.1 hypothetical protein VIBNISO65_380001 [Vibrio nigripulchritudo SO65]
MLRLIKIHDLDKNINKLTLISDIFIDISDTRHNSEEFFLRSKITFVKSAEDFLKAS